MSRYVIGFFSSPAAKTTSEDAANAAAAPSVPTTCHFLALDDAFLAPNAVALWVEADVKVRLDTALAILCRVFGLKRENMAFCERNCQLWTTRWVRSRCA